VEQQAGWYGIAEDDRVWRLRLVPLGTIEWWWDPLEAREDPGDVAQVRDMAEALAAGKWLPPIIVMVHAANDSGRTVTPLDGWHRCPAAKLAGRPSISAWVAMAAV